MSDTAQTARNTKATDILETISRYTTALVPVAAMGGPIPALVLTVIGGLARTAGTLTSGEDPTDEALDAANAHRLASLAEMDASVAKALANATT